VRLSLQFTESRPANVDTDVFLGSSPSKRLTEAHSACLAPLASLFDDYHIESRFYEVNGSVALSLVIPTIDIRSAMDVAEKKTLLDQLMAKSPATWTSTDVFHYLECHGLGAYGSSFVSNSISGPELLRLEADDLREIGVKKLGPLKKILSLITSLAPNKNSESEEERPAAQIQTCKSILPLLLWSHLILFLDPIKCFYEEEIRVVKLSTDLTLGQIQEKLRSLFSENIRIKFKDSDDDLVKLSETSFEHYRETVQSALKTQQSVPVYISEARSRASSSSSRSSKSLPHDLLQCEDPTEALIVTTKQGSVQYMNDVATELLGLGSRRYDRFVFSNYFSHSFEQLQQMYTDFIHENPALEYMVVQDSVAAKTGFENVVLNVSTVALPKSKIAYRFSFKITKDAGHEHVSTLQQIREKITKEKHPVVLFDGSYKVQAFNKSATDTFGYKLHEIVGKDVGILFPHTPLEEIVRHTRSMPRSVISQDKNGGLLNLSITTSSMVDGNTKYYSVVFSN
jgi:PAS domain S-box-containing protein